MAGKPVEEGLPCPHCEATESIVLHTSKWGGQVQRNRRCKSCLKSFCSREFVSRRGIKERSVLKRLEQIEFLTSELRQLLYEQGVIEDLEDAS